MEATICMFGPNEAPYRVIVEKGNALIHIGDYATPQAALNASIEYGALTANCVIRKHPTK